MQAVILAAGEGKRVRPFTRSRPKALIPVANRPIIEYTIQALLTNGVREIIVVVGYRKEQVIRYLNQLDAEIEVVVQERQLGTANALKCAEPLIKGDFLVLPGDNSIDTESIGRIKDLNNAMLVKEHPNPSNFGVVQVRDDLIIGIEEKPADTAGFTVSTGILSLTPRVFEYMQGNDLTDAIACMLEGGVEIRAVVAEDWQDALYPWDLLRMNERLLSGVRLVKGGEIHRSAIVQGKVCIGGGTVVGPNTIITGPVAIGRDSVIGPHCVILPGTSIGARVRVEPFTLIGNSLIMDDAAIGSHTRVIDAVIGEGTILGDHTSFVTAPGILEIEGMLVRTEFGGIIGDRVTSAPFTTYRGCIIGNNVSIESSGRLISSVCIDDETVVV